MPPVDFQAVDPTLLAQHTLFLLRHSSLTDRLERVSPHLFTRFRSAERDRQREKER